jgi:methionine synthase II (cobalamin-independent)
MDKKNKKCKTYSEVYDLISAVAHNASDAAVRRTTDSIMRLLDRHAADERIKARLEVFKNFKAI